MLLRIFTLLFCFGISFLSSAQNIEEIIKTGQKFQAKGNLVEAKKKYKKALILSQIAKNDSLVNLTKYKQILVMGLLNESDSAYINATNLLLKIKGKPNYRILENNLQTIISFIQTDLGLYDKAFESLFRSTLKNKETLVSNYFSLGFIHQQSANHKRANYYYNLALKNQNNKIVYKLLLNAKMENFIEGQEKDSLFDFVSKYKKQTNLFDNLKLAEYYFIKKEYKSAFELINLKKSNNSKLIDSVKYFFVKSLIYNQLNLTDEAILNMEKCIKKNSDDALNFSLKTKAYHWLIHKLEIKSIKKSNQLNELKTAYIQLLESNTENEIENKRKRINILESLVKIELQKKNAEKQLLKNSYNRKIIIISFTFSIAILLVTLYAYRNKKKLIQNDLRMKKNELKEVQHRISNNLQIITGILTIEESKFSQKEEKEIFKESIHKIQLLSLIHSFLSSEKST